MSTRYAVIKIDTNLVINTIVAEDGLSGSTRNGKLLIASETANIGDTYNPGDGTFTAPAPPPDPPATADVVLNVSLANKEPVRQILLGMKNAGLINTITVP